MSFTPRSASTTGTTTPCDPASDPPSQSSSSYLSYPVSHVVSGLYRRLTEPSPNVSSGPKLQTRYSHQEKAPDMPHGVYTPPYRTASPFQPPPLTPLTLSGTTTTTILSRAVAEEIRLLVPPRLQLQDTWSLAYSLEADGVSLATLYSKCASPHIPRNNSFVLVVQDASGGIFGAYLTSPPHPSPHYYGTGECFLWRASILPPSSLLSSLPPPPSAPDTESMGRSTTTSAPHLSPHSANSSTTQNPSGHDRNDRFGATTPDLIRFKAFPYSGVNDYLIFCEPGYLSVGGGDGRYGLWLDGVLERGVSSGCMTFGNEALSEEGEKFEVVGVEVWWVGG